MSKHIWWECPSCPHDLKPNSSCDVCGRPAVRREKETKIKSEPKGSLADWNFTIL